jgi:hypothetical protein
VDADTFIKEAEKVYTMSAWPESLWQLFSLTGLERISDGGIHATRD